MGPVWGASIGGSYRRPSLMVAIGENIDRPEAFIEAPIGGAYRGSYSGPLLGTSGYLNRSPKVTIGGIYRGRLWGVFIFGV